MVECITLFGDKKLIPKDDLIFRPAGYAIIINNDKILLCNTKSTGKYWFPGGAVELGENIEDATKREVLEETGIFVELDKLIYFKEIFFYYDPLNQAYHNLSFFYLCKAFNIKLLEDHQVDLEDESNKPRWVDLNVLKKEDFQPGVEEIVDIILNNKLYASNL